MGCRQDGTLLELAGGRLFDFGVVVWKSRMVQAHGVFPTNGSIGG
jgi:hypothetical protein